MWKFEILVVWGFLTQNLHTNNFALACYDFHSFIFLTTWSFCLFSFFLLFLCLLLFCMESWSWLTLQIEVTFDVSFEFWKLFSFYKSGDKFGNNVTVVKQLSVNIACLRLFFHGTTRPCFLVAYCKFPRSCRYCAFPRNLSEVVLIAAQGYCD